MKKKKRDVEFYKDHTITWAIERLENIRDMMDEIFESPTLSAAEKEDIFRDYTLDVERLVELLAPFEHEHDSLMEWAKNFIDEYQETSA